MSRMISDFFGEIMPSAIAMHDRTLAVAVTY
jgi:hypothetical protein